jgi:drug/metabolite transporter (DMT)-like permease
MLKFLVPLWLIWGINWVVMKISNNYFPPSEFVVWRFGTGALVLLLYILWKKLSLPDKKQLPWIILSGIIGIGISNLLIQNSMLYLGAGMAAIISYSMPVWLLIPAYFLLNEKITVRKIASIVLSLSGLVILMNIDTDNSQFYGVVLALASAWCWVICSVIIKMKLTKCPPIQLSCGQMIAGVLVIAIVNMLHPAGEINWCIESVLCLLYNGVLASAVCFFLWSYILQHMEATIAGAAILVAPAVGVVAGIILLDESFTLSTALGMGLLAIGTVSSLSPIKRN